MMWSDDPIWVNKRKEYGAVKRRYCSALVRGTDGVHPGSSCGCSQQLFPLTLGLILVNGWVAQYVIEGGSGFEWEL